MDKSGNPTLSQGIIDKLRAQESIDHATIGGTIPKVGMLMVLMLASAGYAWSVADTMPFVTMLGALIGLALALVTAFRPQGSAITAPLYAIAEGLFVGGISYFFAQGYGSAIVAQAVGLTGAIFFSTLFLYQARVVRVTDKIRSIILIATFGVALYYVAALVISLFGVQMPLIYDSGPFGIIFSLVVVFIASLNLLLDFDFVERAATYKLPKFFEWYGAFALLVTVVWLYVELLRLLGKTRG